MATGGVVRLRCVHRFGWAYAWFSDDGPLYQSTEKVPPVSVYMHICCIGS